MDCPKCPGKLRERAVGGVRLDRCPMCGGIWLDNAELPRLFELGLEGRLPDLELDAKFDEELLAEVDLEGKAIACPKCGDTRGMKKIPSPRRRGMLLDYCGSCGGVWLDRGELTQVLRSSRLERGFFRFLGLLKRLFPPRKPRI